MHVLYERGAGWDVHKKTVVACVLTAAGPEPRTFGTRTADWLTRSAWLQACGCTEVAMASTGDYWKPVCNMLAGAFAVLLVNAPPVKAVPGRKTDGKDAAWRAARLPHGWLRASFMPPVAQRERRDLPRHRRTGIRERVTLGHRVQQLLEDAHSKLASVASDMMGVSGRAIWAAWLAGHDAPHALAALATGRLRTKRDELAPALEGRITPQQRVVLTERWCQIDSLDETIARLDEPIQAISAPFAAAADVLDTTPGLARQTAAIIGAEIGTDLSRFPRADHLAAWAGVAPGNHARAGKRTSGKPRTGHRSWRTVLVHAAHAAARTRSTSRSAPYRRLATRRGHKRAMWAVAHAMLGMA